MTNIESDLKHEYLTAHAELRRLFPFATAVIVTRREVWSAENEQVVAEWSLFARNNTGNASASASDLATALTMMKTQTANLFSADEANAAMQRARECDLDWSHAEWVEVDV